MGRIRAISVLLFVSGSCALVFQTAWLRELKLIFGGSTASTAAVIAIFMGGMGLGNAFLGPRADASPNPLRLYALLEIGVTFLTAISPFTISVARTIYIAAGGQETLGLAGATVLRLLLAALVLGPQVFLMGATLPAAARAATSSDDVGRGTVGRLYGINTLGAVFGTLVSTFVLLEWLGTRSTLWTACALNLLNATVALQLSKVGGWKRAAETQEESSLAHRPLAEEASPEWKGPPALIYATAGVAGFTFFLMELVWYRMLAPILGGTTFAFGLILAVALAGIAVGGMIYPLTARNRGPRLNALALTLGWEALAIAIPFALGDRVAILAGILRPLAAIGFSGQVFGWLLVTLVVVFPAAVVSGIQFPQLVALLGAGNHRVGEQLGKALAWNTLGAIAGALAGGFGLIGLLTAVGAWMLAVVVLVVSAGTLIAVEFWSTRQFSRLIQPLCVAVAAVMCLSATGPTAVWRHSGIGGGRANIPFTSQNDLRAWMNTSRRNVIWEADGREASVAISTDRGIGFVVNGKSDGSAIHDTGTQIMLGVLAALLHPQPRDGLVIGLGTGESAGCLAHQSMMEQVDVVEIEPVIRQVAELCAPLNHDVMRHPKVRVVYNDARETLLSSRRQYDVIASEPSNPYRSGVSSLYTREFYLAVRNRLKAGGIFLQWLQGYEIDAPTVRLVLRTLSSVFRHVEIWELSPGDLALVCSVDPLEYTASELRSRIEQPAMREALRIAWRCTTLEGVVSHLIASERFAEAVSSETVESINTDDRNLLEYRFARTVGQAGSFSVNGLRAEAANSKSLSLPRLEKDIDWEAVEDARIAYYAASGDEPISPEVFTGDRAKRAQALMAFESQGQLVAIARLWDSQPRPPSDLIETLAVAVGAAAQGDERAMRVIEPIRPMCPIEAGFVVGLLALKQNRPDDGARALSILFKALRSDPTPLAIVVEHAVRTALEIASQDPRQIPLLFNSLREPFALRMAEESRARALCLLANSIGPREMVEALAQVEPNPWWNARMLELRVKAYAAERHPLLLRARAELDEFQGKAGENAVLIAP